MPIGDKYVSITPGAGEKILKNGDALRLTQSSFVLEDAIGQLINGNSSSSSGGGGSGGSGSSAPSSGRDKNLK